MLTRCPACETRFRVTAEQLKARSGRVRCGECQHVFNALDSLIEAPTVMVAPLPAEPPHRRLAAPPSDIGADLAIDPEARLAEVAVTCPRSGIPVMPGDSTQSAPAPSFQLVEDAQNRLAAWRPETPKPAIPERAEAAEPVTATGGAVPDWSDDFPAPPPPPHRWPWAVGGILALTALGLQAVLAFRVELAVLWPEAKPTLVALCEIADCEVGLPAKVALMGIEASDLHPDTRHTSRLALTATLKNRAPFTQQYPHLELTLTDTADKAIARKVLAPADYLPPKASPAQGMQPNADIMVAVGVDPGAMTASGYRLYLFYP